MNLDRRIAALEQRRGSGFVVPARDAEPESLSCLQAMYLMVTDPDMPEDRMHELQAVGTAVDALLNLAAFSEFCCALPEPVFEELAARLAEIAGDVD